MFLHTYQVCILPVKFSNFNNKFKLTKNRFLNAIIWYITIKIFIIVNSLALTYAEVPIVMSVIIRAESVSHSASVLHLNSYFKKISKTIIFRYFNIRICSLGIIYILSILVFWIFFLFLIPAGYLFTKYF